MSLDTRRPDAAPPRAGAPTRPAGAPTRPAGAPARPADAPAQPSDGQLHPDGLPPGPHEGPHGAVNPNQRSNRRETRENTGGRRRRRPTRWTYWRRRIVALFVVAGLWFAWSIGGALTAPGTDGVAERVAQWARIHNFGWAITAAEKVKYQLHDKPATGGQVSGIPTVDEASAPKEPSAKPSIAAPPKVPTSTAPGNLSPIAAGSVDGEGVWQPMYDVKGEHAAYATYLRPDAEHTSYLVGLVWMDPKLVSFRIHPGYNVPGGSGWAQENQVPKDLRANVLATFNSGFMMQDARGGMWQQGKQVGALTRGAASMVVNTDGTFDVRAWEGGEPGPGIDTVRQNLVLMLDGGEVTQAVTNASYTAQWGATIGNAAFVWRSAVGVRNDGTVVFVAGPAMSIRSLAEVMKRAGVVRAMELDINPSWTNYITYTQDNGQTTPHMFPQGAQPNPWRYLTPSTRDFVGVYPRS